MDSISNSPHDIDDDSFKTREQYLLDWTTAKCKDGRSIDFDEGWDIIQKYGVQVLQDSLLRAQPLSCPFGRKAYSSLYTISYKISCRNDMNRLNTDISYERYKDIIKQFCEECKVQLSSKHESFFIKEFLKAWSNFKLFSKWMWKLFMHLDRFVVPEKQLIPLEPLSKQIFFEQLYVTNKLVLVNAVLDAIESERRGAIIDLEDIQNAIQVFNSMGPASKVHSTMDVDDILIYQADFETEFLEQTTIFYQSERVRLRTQCDVPTFILAVEVIVKHEKTRLLSYLHSSTESKLMSVVLRVLVMEELDFLRDGLGRLMSGFLDLSAEANENEGNLGRASLSSVQISDCFNSVNISSLHPTMNSVCDSVNFSLTKHDLIIHIDRLYSILLEMHSTVIVADKLPACELLKPYSDAVRDVILSVGERIIADRRSQLVRVSSNRAREYDRDRDAVTGCDFIAAVLELMSRLMLLKMWSCPHFSRGIRSSLSSIMNCDVGVLTPAIMLASHIDALLKGKLRISECDHEYILDKCMTLFSLLNDKDVFLEVYKTALSKRLLWRSSTCYDLDKFVVSRLKSECGINFASKVEGMLKDMDVARSSATAFSLHRQRMSEGSASTELNMEFAVTVLNTGFWPVMKHPGCPVPPVFAPYVQRFEAWYRSCNKSHRLKWELGVGEAVVRAAISGRSFDLVVSTPQAIVLSIFDNCDNKLTVQEIRDRTGFSNTEMLFRVLHSLAFLKDKVILKKEPSTCTKIAETDVFSVNRDFSSKLRKFRIPLAHDDESTSANQYVVSSVNANRKYLIQASIVRLMKARKLLSHSELVAEVVRQLISFQPQKSSIKLEIEKLIENEYIVRAPSDSSSYIYVP